MKFFREPAFWLAALRVLVGGGLVWQGFHLGGVGGLVQVVAGAFFFGPELRWLISERVARFVSGFVFPEATGSPPLDYTLPRFYRKKERLPEALEHYQRILHFYPKDLTAYREGIEVAWELNDEGEALRLYRRGMRRLPAAERGELTRHWEAGRGGAFPAA